MARVSRVTAVFDRSTMDLARLKSELGIDGNEFDARLSSLLAATKRTADSYINNPFVEEDDDTLEATTDPPTPQAIPEDVEEGILAAIESRLAKAPFGVSEEKVDDLSRKFAVYATAADALKDIKATYWRHWRRLPGL